MILGIFLLLFSKFRKASILLATLVIVSGIFTIMRPGQVYAETTTQVSIRLEQPKTGVTDREFEITYVALSIPMKALEIECKYSTDGLTYLVFDTLKTTNSGSCKVDESIITGSGSYYFLATATAEDGAYAKSEEIKVSITNNPSPVTEYSKTEGTCTYTLKFKSTTSKVQIYRSDNQKSFYADDTTLITKPSLSVTPNVLTTYTDSSITDCSKDYYYAIRSIDDYNNVSTLVTDDIVTIVRTPAPITPTTPTEITDDEGEVEGDETAIDEEEKEDEKEEGDVKGDEDTDSENGEEDQEDENSIKSIWDEYRYLIIAMVVVALGSGVYNYVRRKK